METALAEGDSTEGRTFRVRRMSYQSFEEMTFESYQVFTLFVEYLILEFGEDKILKLIEGLSNGEVLNNLFQEFYKKSFEELIEDGNKYHEITRS